MLSVNSIPKHLRLKSSSSVTDFQLARNNGQVLLRCTSHDGLNLHSQNRNNKDGESSLSFTRAKSQPIHSDSMTNSDS
eukprot:Awhi_evm1s5816